MRHDEPSPNRIFANADATAQALEADRYLWNAICRARKRLDRPLDVADVKAARREATTFRRRHELQEKTAAAKDARRAKRPLTRKRAVCKLGSGVTGPSVEEIERFKAARRRNNILPIPQALIARALGVRKVG